MGKQLHENLVLGIIGPSALDLKSIGSAKVDITSVRVPVRRIIMTTDIQYTTGRRKEPVSGIAETVPREFDRARISEDITLTLNGEGVTIGKSLKTDLIAANKLFLESQGKKTEATKKCY